MGVNRVVILAFILPFFSTLLSSSLEADERFTVVHSYFKPFVWSEKNVSKGIYVDVLKEAIEKRIGVPVHFKSYPWKRAQYRVQTGKEDGFITVVTPERLKYTLASNEPIIISQTSVFTYKHHPAMEELKTVRDIESLRDYRILTYVGDGWAKKYLIDHKVDFGGLTLETTLRKLSRKRGDIIIHPLRVTSFTLKKIGLSKAIVPVPGATVQETELKLMIGKHSPYLYLLPELDDALIKMKQSGALKKIYEKY